MNHELNLSLSFIKNDEQSFPTSMRVDLNYLTSTSTFHKLQFLRVLNSTRSWTLYNSSALGYTRYQDHIKHSLDGHGTYIAD